MFGYDDKRDELLLERRKTVAKGDNNLAVGNYFTHSFNMGCGDRSYMNCIWQVISLTAQQVYAVCALNTSKDETDAKDSIFNDVGKRHMFDRGEYQFYDAKELYDTIVAERKLAADAKASALASESEQEAA